MAKQSDQSRKDEKGNDFEEKVLHINRCSKVVKGGRKFSFSALILVGDGKGKVGYGFAKANELTDAIKKGGEIARQNLVDFPKEGSTIPHEVHVSWDGSSLMLKPAPAGTGVIAGSRLRSILEMAGVEDVIGKILSPGSPINLVKATFKALEKLSSRNAIRKSRESTT